MTSSRARYDDAFHLGPVVDVDQNLSYHHRYLGKVMLISMTQLHVSQNSLLEWSMRRTGEWPEEKLGTRSRTGS